MSEWISYAYDAEKHIKSEKEISFEEGVSHGMSLGISQGISQGISHGISQGISLGRLEAFMDCVSEGVMSVSAAAQKCEMSEEKFIDKMQTIGKKIPETTSL